MLFEYAVEPVLLNNWPSFRYFYEKFGVPQGRLISRYPKHWERLVYEALNGCGEIERLRIVERLKEIKNRMLNSGRVYDPELCWLENAEVSHTFREFRAIVACSNPRGRDFVLEGDSLDERNPRWKAETRMPLPRQAPDMVQAIKFLLQMARSVVLVDPHFTPTVARYRETLRAFVAASIKINGSFPDQIELLLSTESDHNWFEQECRARLPRILPPAMVVHIRILSQIAGGEKFHNRYVLTDRGGAAFGVGLDQGEPGESDDLALMSDTLFDKRWGQYGQGALAFKTEYEFDVTGQV